MLGRHDATLGKAIASSAGTLGGHNGRQGSSAGHYEDPPLGNLQIGSPFQTQIHPGPALDRVDHHLSLAPRIHVEREVTEKILEEQGIPNVRKQVVGPATVGNGVGLHHASHVG